MKIPQQGEVRKPAKTMAGVTPLTVVLAPRKCEHGTCIYCPGGETVPQSYTDKSPAVMRGLMLDYNPYEQVKVRLKAFKIMNHPTDKIELIILGGTFLQYSKNYKDDFIKGCYDALNGKESRDFGEAKEINDFYIKMRSWKSISTNADFPNFFETVIRESGFLQSIMGSEQRTEKMNALSALFDEIKNIVLENISEITVGCPSSLTP